MQTNPNNSYERGFFDGLLPPPILTVSQWADRNRILSSVSSPNPGKWKTTRTPYLREPMDCLSSHSPVEMVDLMFGSQLGKTEVVLNWSGYKIDHSPGPMMIVQPTVDMAKRFSKQRIATLSETPAIKEKLRPARERDSGNTILQKDFPGGTLILTGANSAVGLSSAPVGALGLDEEDRFPEMTDEGDPVELAEARTKNFVNSKILRTSTPTTVERSRIYKGFLEGDMSRYHVPCPHCKELQVLKWGDETSSYGIKWETGKPDTAYYLCEKNGCVIEEYHKDWMLQEENGAKWVAEKPELSEYHRSFHLPTIYSPWYSWGKAVRKFLKAKKHPERLKAFVNTYLGEPWAEKEAEVPDWRILYGRREPSIKIGSVPAAGLMLTGACDVQKNRIEAQVVAWGSGRQSWVIDKREFIGSPLDFTDKGPWVQVDAFLHEQFPHESGLMMPMRMVGIDSGYETQAVYNFVRKYPAGRVIATRGFDHLKMILGTPSPVDVNFGGKKIKRGLRLFPIGSSHIKDEIYGLLKLQMPTETELAENGFPDGFIHFPEFDEEFFEQMTAEHKTYRIEKGFRKYYWEKLRERNEQLDMFAINRAVASLCGIDRMSSEDWAELAKQFDPIARVDETQSINSGNEEYIPRKKSNFW